MASSSAEHDTALRASELCIPSSFDLLFDMELPALETGAVHVFITVAEHIQDTKPDGPGDIIAILKAWATFLADPREGMRFTFQDVLHDAQTYEMSMNALRQAVDIFDQIASDWERHDYGEPVMTALVP